MNLKKAKLEGHIVDIVSLEVIANSPEAYETGPTAVEIQASNGETVVLPYKPNNAESPSQPGVYNLGNVGVIAYLPDESRMKQYQPEIINFGTVENIQEYIDKQEKVRDLEKEILTGKDNVYKPYISDQDTPEMRGLKEAILAKGIDLDKYADRFGANYPNDKRKLRDNNITLFLLKRMCDCLDMKAELIISDKSADVVNPIGKTIHIDLTMSESEADNADTGSIH